MRAARSRKDGARHPPAGYRPAGDRPHGHARTHKKRTRLPEPRRCPRSPHPQEARIAITCDNYSPHLSTKKDSRAGVRAAAGNAGIARTPTGSSRLNRMEAQLTALRRFALDGTAHRGHKEQASTTRRYITWRSRHAAARRLRTIVERANVA